MSSFASPDGKSSSNVAAVTPDLKSGLVASDAIISEQSVRRKTFFLRDMIIIEGKKPIFP